LYCWLEWAGDEEPKQWAETAVSSDQGLVSILESFLQKSHIKGESDVIATIHYRFDPHLLEPFLDPSQIIERIRGLVDAGWLTELQSIAVNQFIEGYEMMEREENPDSHSQA
jgi:hypothetical protein